MRTQSVQQHSTENFWMEEVCFRASQEEQNPLNNLVTHVIFPSQTSFYMRKLYLIISTRWECLYEQDENNLKSRNNHGSIELLWKSNKWTDPTPNHSEIKKQDSAKCLPQEPHTQAPWLHLAFQHHFAVVLNTQNGILNAKSFRFPC